MCLINSAKRLKSANEITHLYGLENFQGIDAEMYLGRMIADERNVWMPASLVVSRSLVSVLYATAHIALKVPGKRARVDE